MYVATGCFLLCVALSWLWYTTGRAGSGSNSAPPAGTAGADNRQKWVAMQQRQLDVKIEFARVQQVRQERVGNAEQLIATPDAGSTAILPQRARNGTFLTELEARARQESTGTPQQLSTTSAGVRRGTAIIGQQARRTSAFLTWLGPLIPRVQVIQPAPGADIRARAVRVELFTHHHERLREFGGRTIVSIDGASIDVGNSIHASVLLPSLKDGLHTLVASIVDSAGQTVADDQQVVFHFTLSEAEGLPSTAWADFPTLLDDVDFQDTTSDPMNAEERRLALEDDRQLRLLQDAEYAESLRVDQLASAQLDPNERLEAPASTDCLDATSPTMLIELPPEPPTGAQDAIEIVIHLPRLDDNAEPRDRIRRRFYKAMPMHWLFALLQNAGLDAALVRLASRFPREVFNSANHGTLTLEEAGLRSDMVLFAELV